MKDAIIWHDLECGGYDADMPLWRELAGAHAGPVLDLGAGTGRVALDLASAGHHIVALDIDGCLLEVLAARGRGLGITTVVGDARGLSFDRRFDLILAPMQTVQLLGGPAGRDALLAGLVATLAPGGLFAAALAEDVEPYAAGGPEPDVAVHDGVTYRSDPFAIVQDDVGYLLHRARVVVAADGTTTPTHDTTRLDELDASTLEAEALAHGLHVLPRRYIDETDEHVGSTVVMLGG